MVFSSIPPYLDPSNWQQQQVNHHHHLLLQGGTTNTQTPHLPPPPPQPPAQPHVVGGGGSIRPGSMAERARMANIPVPETALKCPRCDSTNTKFCYFNNYSLSQPRHFCKTCRRYWTRGGALRSVPVGGGCRRNNKRSGKGGGGGGGGASSSSTTSKSTSTAASNDRQSNSSGFTSSSRGIAQLVDQSIINGLSSPFSAGLSGPTGHNLNLLGLSPQIPSQTFMSPLGQLSDHHYPAGISPPSANLSENIMTLQLGGGDNLLGGSIEPWRLQQPPQFPFLDPMYNFHGGFESPTGFIGSGPSGQIRPRISSAMLAQLAAVKMENNNNNNNEESRFSRQILGINNNEHWNGDNNGGAWSDISASFSSSSTSNTHL